MKDKTLGELYDQMMSVSTMDLHEGLELVANCIRDLQERVDSLYERLDDLEDPTV